MDQCALYVGLSVCLSVTLSVGQSVRWSGIRRWSSFFILSTFIGFYFFIRMLCFYKKHTVKCALAEHVSNLHWTHESSMLLCLVHSLHVHRGCGHSGNSSDRSVDLFTPHNQVSIFNSPYHCLCADVNQPSETTPNQSSVSKIQTVAKHCPIYCQEQKFPESIH